MAFFEENFIMLENDDPSRHNPTSQNIIRPDKKNQYTVFFLDRTTTLCAVDGWISDENVVREVNHWCWLIHGSSTQRARSAKDAEKRNQVPACIEMTLSGM